MWRKKKTRYLSIRFSRVFFFFFFLFFFLSLLGSSRAIVLSVGWAWGAPQKASQTQTHPLPTNLTRPIFLRFETKIGWDSSGSLENGLATLCAFRDECHDRVGSWVKGTTLWFPTIVNFQEQTKKERERQWKRDRNIYKKIIVKKITKFIKNCCSCII